MTLRCIPPALAELGRGTRTRLERGTHHVVAAQNVSKLIPVRESGGIPRLRKPRLRRGFVRKSRKLEYVALSLARLRVSSMRPGKRGLLELAQLRSIEIRPA